METPYRYRPALYFVLTFVLTWTPLFIAMRLAQAPRETYGHALNFVGLLGPSVAALLLVYMSGHPAVKADFKDRLLNLRRISLVYLLATVLLMPLAMLLAIGISLFFGQSADQFKIIDGWFKWLPILLLAPTLEELGWRGYAVDSLRSKMSMLNASLLFASLWALWHAPLFFIKGTYHSELVTMGAVYVANFFLSVIPAGILANWLYYKHRRSIIAGILFHFMLNLIAILFSATQVTKCIVTLVFLAVAVLVILLDRSFREGKRDFLPDAVGSADLRVGSLTTM